MKNESLPEYRDFVDQVTVDIMSYLPDELKDAEIDTKLIEKLQGASYYGIVVRPSGSDICVCLNLTPAFQMYHDGKATYDQVLSELSNNISSALDNRPAYSILALTSYEAMRKFLMIQVVSRAANEEMLKNIPHYDIEDLSIIYKFILSHTCDGTTSVLLTNNLLKEYNLTPEQLHDDAVTNSAKRFPVSLLSMADTFTELFGFKASSSNKNDSKMFVATCNNADHGAGCIFYPGFLDDAAKKLEGDFYLLPSSVHEFILIPSQDYTNPSDLLEIVKEVNKTSVLQEEKLTDSVYFYDSKLQSFHKVNCEI